MLVKVRFYGRLAEVLGVRELELDSPRTLRDVLAGLKQKLGDRVGALVDERGNLRPGVLVLINGEAAAFRGGLDARVGGGDDVVFDTIDIYEVEGGG